MSTHCQRCGRPLKDPKSRARGFGPTCYEKFTQERLKTLGLDGEDTAMTKKTEGYVLLDTLRLDGGTQPRVEIDQATVDEYAEDMRNSEEIEFPPVVVFYDGTHYWLADGFHRVLAAAQLEMDAFPADVRDGTLRDAVLYSCGANATHGLRRSNLDKNAAIEKLLRDEEWVQWSDSEIARQCGVSDKTVARIRSELELSSEIPKIEARSVQRGGTTYTMDTTEIGEGQARAAKEPTWFVAYTDAGLAASGDTTLLAIGQSGKVLVAFDYDAEDVAKALGAELSTFGPPKWADSFTAIKISALHAPTLRRLEEKLGTLNIVRSDDPNLKHFADTQLHTVEYQPSADDGAPLTVTVSDDDDGVVADVYQPSADGGPPRAGREIETGIPGTRAWQFDPLPDELAQEAEEVEPRGDDTDEWIASVAAGEEYYPEVEEPVLPDGVREQAVEAYGAHVVEALEVALHNLAVCEAALDNARRGDQTDLGGPAAEYAFKQFNFAAPHLVAKFELLLHRPAELAEMREHLALASTAADLDEIAGIITKLRAGQPNVDAPIDAFHREIQAARRKLEQQERARQEAQGL